jgi:hypothetical protein
MRFLHPALTRVSSFALIAAFAGALTGCGDEGSAQDGQLPLLDRESVCAHATQSRSISQVELNIGLGGAPIAVAADRVRIELDASGLASIDTIGADLALSGMCLGDVDAARGYATVRLVPALSLEKALSQLATIDAIASVHVDPMLKGTGNDDDDDGGGNDDDDDGGGNDDDDDCGKSKKKHDDDDDDGKGKGKGKGKKAKYDGPSMWHLAALRLGPALKIQPGAPGITVAILDTGLTTNASGAEAPGLGGSPIAAGHDFINADADPADDDGHGTMLAGILASTGDYPGVAPGVTIMPVKVLDSARQGTESALTDGINYAVANGADIISMSLAFPPGYIPSYELADAVHRADEAGVVLIGASGNHGTGEIGYPAAFGEVLAVGGGRMAKKFGSLSPKKALAVNGQNIAKKIKKADYSGWGANIDVLAPGGSMEHDLDGDGFPDAVPAIGFTNADPTYAGYLMAGTSPATVQVAGVASLLLAGGADAASIRPLMMHNATSIAPNGFDIFAGAGVVDARDSVKKLSKGQIPATPKLFANPIVTLANDTDGNRRAIAMVEIIDENNDPVVGAKVLGHFRGAVGHSSEATSDAQGRVVMVSNAGLPTSDIFEFGVDKVIQCIDWKNGKCKQEQISIPGAFARFELESFYFFSAFEPGGQGIQPTPFMIFIPTDVLSPMVADFSLSGTAGAPATPDPVNTIPADFASYSLVEALLVRSFGTGGSVAPVVFTIAKSVLLDGCAIADRGTTVPVTGGGIQPTPFRIGDDLAGLPTGFDNITTRSDGGLFLNGLPTSAPELGLLTGTTGTVLIAADGSICLPQSREVHNMDHLASDIVNGSSVNSHGITFTGTPDAAQAPPSPVDIDDTNLGKAIGQGLVSSASLGGSAQASAAVQP